MQNARYIPHKRRPVPRDPFGASSLRDRLDDVLDLVEGCAGLGLLSRAELEDLLQHVQRRAAAMQAPASAKDAEPCVRF